MENKSVIWLVAVLFIVLIGAGVFGYIYYNKYQEKDEDLKTSQRAILQNEKYHQEIQKQKDDSLQILSGLIKDLNKENKDIKKKFITQVTDLQLQIASLKDSGKAIANTGIDDLGLYLDIPFQGTHSIISYSGYTRHYYNLNKNYWYLNFDFKPIDVYSTFYLDSVNVWRINTISRTPGIKLRTDYHIDPSFYSHFENINPEIFAEDKNPIILRLKASIIGSWSSNDFYRKHPIKLSMELYFNSIYGTYQPLQSYVSLGFYHDINVTKSFNSIKKVFSIF